MKRVDELPFLNFLSPEFQADPAPILGELRSHAPTLQTAIGGLVIDHGTVEALLALDGADHVRRRKLGSRAFTPRAVERLRRAMRSLTEELIDGFAGRGSCEFMAEFAKPPPRTGHLRDAGCSFRRPRRFRALERSDYLGCCRSSSRTDWTKSARASRACRATSTI